MAVDEALLSSCKNAASPPVLRLYGWSQPTITVGHSQNIERDIDLEKAGQLGVDVVRRPTGGRALWHGNELTYAVVAPLGAAGLGHHLKDIFESISRFLIAGLVQLGVPQDALDFQDCSRRQAGTGRSAACFAELHFGEITFEGRKLIGSAQRRTQHAFLQHGSILIDEDFDRFTQVCRFENEADRQSTSLKLKAGSTTLQNILSTPLSFEQVEKALVAGFNQELGNCLKPGKLSDEESALKDAILERS